jgi:hypothetical protein
MVALDEFSQGCGNIGVTVRGTNEEIGTASLRKESEVCGNFLAIGSGTNEEIGTASLRKESEPESEP